MEETIDRLLPRKQIEVYHNSLEAVPRSSLVRRDQLNFRIAPRVFDLNASIFRDAIISSSIQATTARRVCPIYIHTIPRRARRLLCLPNHSAVQNFIASSTMVVWASLIPGLGGNLFCGAPHRAPIVLEAIHDRRADAAHGDVCIYGIDNLEQIYLWAASLPVGCPQTKTAFVFDVLVEEAQGNAG
jgi:hypothetical protein